MALDTSKTAHEIITSGRSTGQTVIDSDKKMKWALHNLVDTRLDDANEWNPVRLASVVRSGSDANGKKRYLLTENSEADSNHHVERLVSVVSGETYTVSAVVKSNGRYVAINTGGAFDSERWVFDLDTLGVTKQSGTSTTSTATATALTDGEVRIEFTATAVLTGSYTVQFRLWDGSAGNTTYDGDGTSGLYVSEAKVYQSTIGPRELIPNGTFGSGTADWLDNSSGTASFTVSSGVATLDRGDQSSISIYQSFPTVVGETYKLRVDKQSGFIIVRAGPAFNSIANYNGANDGTDVDTSFVATATETFITLINNQASVGTLNSASVLRTFDTMQRDKNGSNFIENETGAALYSFGVNYETGVGGMQVWEGRTNLIPNFEVNNANWNPSGGGVLTDQSLSVLGVFAGCLVESGGSVNHGAINVGVFNATSGVKYAASFVWSDSDSDSIRIRLFEASVDNSVATVTAAGVFTAELTSSGPVVLGSHLEIAPGIYRTTVIWTPNFTGNSLVAGGPNSATPGDGIILYAVQFEAGSSGSPLIPTYGTSQTRGADKLSTLLSSFGYNVNEGTVVADFISAGSDGADFPRVWQLSTSVDNTTRVALVTVNNYNLVVADNSVTQATLVMDSVVPFEPVSIAGAFKTDDFSASQDGGAVVTDTSGTLPSSFTQMIYGRAFIGDYLNGEIRNIAYYPKRLSDATLVEATS